MKSISNLSAACIIAAAIVLIGEILNKGLSTVAAAAMGFTGTYSLGAQAIALYCLSGILFALGVGLAILSIMIERRKNK